jgi:cytoskeletal protein RodZ
MNAPNTVSRATRASRQFAGGPMKTQNSLQVRVIVLGLVLAMLLYQSSYAAAQAPASSGTTERQSETTGLQQPSAPGNTTASGQTVMSQPTQPSGEQLPDSPGAVLGQSNSSAPQPPSQTQEQQQAQEPENRPHEPVGTAAAESVSTIGVAASRPAGAALAPAKQRRVRSILIKVGALVGVGAAVGITMALSQGSPSRPPGSH